MLVVGALLIWSSLALAREAGAAGLPGWFSILPPVIAIALAPVTRRVVPWLQPRRLITVNTIRTLVTAGMTPVGLLTALPVRGINHP